MKVSIIITAEKDRGFLDNAIKSALNQDFNKDNYEMILASDGNSELNEYALKYRIGYAYQEHKGLSANLNNGVRQAKGEYIKVLQDDDMLTPNSLASLIDAIEKEKGSFAHGKARNLYDTQNSRIIEPRDKHPGLSSLMEHNHIHGGTTLYKRNIFEALGGFDENLWTGEEFDFHLRLLSTGHKIAYTPDVVYIYRCHQGQKSRRKSRAQHSRRRQAMREIKRKYRGGP